MQTFLKQNGGKIISPQCNHLFYNKKISIQTPLEEKKYRHTWIFHFHENGFKRIAITKTDLKKSSMKVVALRELRKFEIENSIAVFTYTPSPDSATALWKISWFKGDIQYEFYAEDDKSTVSTLGDRTGTVKELVINFKNSLCL